ncbi:predicted protein [Lichtheimia corymbifera JMRC:FSU:9682]|uniref:Uncharacterized protein n=1 Tax=Lichtheimia corymbifera JMRC:FSU:9682 TaxID=1263082 RepID=A0A068SGH5_9FUNG|nr:predicted protein [Lichtheimia corymbifera JMRC:FSU:9682]
MGQVYDPVRCFETSNGRESICSQLYGPRLLLGLVDNSYTVRTAKDKGHQDLPYATRGIHGYVDECTNWACDGDLESTEIP